jgi:hypothetical protein
MIVDIVNVECFTVFESKNDSPVSTYRHRPEARKPALQLVKFEAWKRNILNFNGRVQDTENEPEARFVLGPNAGVASFFKKLTQPLMGKTTNHEN